MSEPSGVVRRLAAIMAADMVGYSVMMGLDEEGAFAAVRSLRHDILQPAFNAHEGRLFKTTGDGFLVEFASPLGAVRCAVAIQSALIGNTLQLRIGINTGDVLVEDNGDIYGDDVNVAVRIESLATPSGIVLSSKAYLEVAGKLTLKFIDLGECQLKNILKPIRVFSINNAPTEEKPIYSHTKSEDEINPLSIAVMPFDNLLGDQSQDYFCDGLVDSLTTDIALHTPNLFVAGRSSAFTYKGSRIDSRQVSRDLHVRYILQGSMQRFGGRFRINAQLVDGVTGVQQWAERFDGDAGDPFGVQDEVTSRIANSIAGAIYAERSRAFESRRGEPGVMDLVLQGWAKLFLGDRSKAAFDAAEPYYRAALALEPTNPDANIGLGCVIAGRLFNVDRYSLSIEALKHRVGEAHKFLDLGLSQRPEAAMAHSARCILYAVVHRWREALSACELAHSLDGSSSLYLINIANCRTALGDPESSLEYLEKGLRRSPRDPNIGILYSAFGRAYLLLGRWQESIAYSLKARVNAPTLIVVHLALAAAFAQAGDEIEAKASLAEAFLIEPNISFAWLDSHAWSFDPAYLRFAERTFYAGLRKAGLG
jgi:adenylate cyclase